MSDDGERDNDDGERDNDNAVEGEGEADGPTDTTPSDHPIDGIPFIKAAALASVTPPRLDTLLTDVQRDLASRIDDYRRRYERIVTDGDRETFLVDLNHWETIADRLDLTDRERDAVARAHEAAVERAGSSSDRREEFETALEIRSAVVVAVPDGEMGGDDPGTTDAE